MDLLVDKVHNREHTIQTSLVGTISIFTVTSVGKTNIFNFIGMVFATFGPQKI